SPDQRLREAEPPGLDLPPSRSPFENGLSHALGPLMREIEIVSEGAALVRVTIHPQNRPAMVLLGQEGTEVLKRSIHGERDLGESGVEVNPLQIEAHLDVRLRLIDISL